MSDECLLIGGSDGGKSTFMGGILHYVYQSDDFNGTREFLYNEEEIRTKIMQRMEGENKYPKKTDDPYLLRLKLETGGALLGNQHSIDIMDIPGEKLIPNPPESSSFDERLFGKSEKEKLEERYRHKLKPALESGEPNFSTNQWKDLFQYRYIRSGMVIVMLNLHKLRSEDRGEPLLLKERTQILDAIRPVQRKLILVTACDRIGYDPESFTGEPSSISGAVRDQELSDRMTSNLPRSTAEEIKLVLDEVTAVSSGISLLGVSVPAVEGTDNDVIQGTTGDFETRGFQNVIEWLTQ